MFSLWKNLTDESTHLMVMKPLRFSIYSWIRFGKLRISRICPFQHPICKTEKETQMHRTDFWTRWEKVSVG